MANSNRLRNNLDSSPKLEQLYRSVYTSEPLKPLPLSWSPKCRSNDLKIPQLGLSITCIADPPTSRQNPLSDIHIVRADHPIPFSAGIYYFETTICTFKQNCAVVIGIASKRATKTGIWDASAFGYHCDGSLYNHTTQSAFGPKFGEQDVIGCGVDLITKSLFFTKNGELLGKAYEGKIPLTHESDSRVIDIYPVIALEGQGCRVKTNFGEQPFFFPFRRYLAEERELHENQLIGLLDKEFINIKMRELVGSYLVHHGYIDSAKAFARWNGYAEAASSPKKTRSEAPMEKEKGEIDTEAEPPESCLPGFSSMQHRRSLQAFCYRCQYGRVANTLSTLYPNVVERYPELILQLRCRQLVEMMCRHSEHRSGQALSSSDPKLQHQTMGGVSSRKRPCTTVNASCCGCGTSESVPTLATCDDVEVQSSISKYFHTDSLHGTTSKAHFPIAGSSAATSYDAMDIDSSLGLETSVAHLSHSQQQQQHLTGTSASIASSSSLVYGVNALGVAGASSVNDFFDEDFVDTYDDDFGIRQQKPMEPTPMDTESASSAPAPTVATFSLAPPEPSACQSASNPSLCTSLEGEAEERRRLMHQIQFSRSLVDLARKVKGKRGSLSEDTARLVHQSVSLMAYPSPSSPECPLRCLLDPSWREKIASLINSAILTEAHKMPPQPAIEQAIYTLQACLADSNCLEAQTLGHFLLYHLPQSEYAAELRFIRKTTDASDSSPSNLPTDSAAGAAFEHSVDASHSIDQRRRREESGSPTGKNNGASATSNGRVASPKGHIHSSNGASRRHRRRRRTTRSGARYAPVETLPSTDEEDVEVEADDISMEEGVQLHHHAELEDDQEEMESLEDEAGVELMTATMEDDGFDEEEEEQQQNPEGEEENEEAEEEEQGESDDGDGDEDVEMAVEEELVERELPRRRRETYTPVFLTQGRFVPSEASIVAAGTGGDSSSGSSSRTRASPSTTSSSRRSEPFSTHTSVVTRLPGGFRPRRYPRLHGNSGGAASGRSVPPSRPSRRSGATSNDTTNSTNQ